VIGESSVLLLVTLSYPPLPELSVDDELGGRGVTGKSVDDEGVGEGGT
jgi:hypothetical protein